MRLMRFACGPGVEVIAHRGASMEAPEHTFAAFDLALAQGTDTLELDLRATADGHVVVLHDPTLARTHGDPRAIARVHSADLPAGRAVLSLAEVLERYAGAARLLLELKPGGAPVEAVVRQVAGMAGVVLQSFDRSALRRAARHAPGLAFAPLFTSRPTPRQLDRAARGAEGVGVPHALVDAALVGAVHRRGLRLRAYTANEPEELLRLVALGVDGLITDAPARARAALAAVASAAA